MIITNRYKDWRGREVMEIDKSYKVIYGFSFFRMAYCYWGYKFIDGKFKRVCKYFFSTFYNYKQPLRQFVSQIDYEYKSKYGFNKFDEI